MKGIYIKRTQLYEEHVKLGAKIVPFAGWEMPVFYSSVIDEHLTTRSNAGLFDISHMGEFFIEGKSALNFLQRMITNDLSKLEDGKAFYTSMCLENGGIIDDLFIYRFNHSKFMMVVNAVNIEKDFNWLMDHKSFFDDVTIINKSNEAAKLDLQGPKSQEILQKLVDFDLNTLKRFYFVESHVNSVPAIISRTGYTGEDGFEIYFNSAESVKQWNKLLEVGKEFGLKPIGLGARDTLRIEACYSLYGHELTEHVNPLETGVGFVVKFDKGEFVGRDVLLRRKELGLKHKIVAFEMIDKSVPRQDYKILKDGVEIGYVTSGTMSPTFKKGIGMAYLRISEAGEGNEININIREKLYRAKVIKRPIYKYNGKV
ncbi:MAG: glycine cleavage system aminomethyltransferase GcvT [Nanoarchaeota archaeon]